MTTHYEKIQALGNRMASNLETMGVSASFGDGGLTLADKILQIQRFTNGLLLYADKNIIQIGDTVNLYALLLEDGKAVSGETITFFKEITPTTKTDRGIEYWVYTVEDDGEITFTGKTVGLFQEGQQLYSTGWGSNGTISVSISNSTLTVAKDGTPLSPFSFTYDSSKPLEIWINKTYTILTNSFGVIGTDTTDSSGVATVSYTGKGAGLLNIKAFASNRSIQSEIFVVTDCITIDNATLSDHKDIWSNTAQSGVNFERKEEYTEFTITTANNKYIPLNLTLPSSVAIEMEAYSLNNQNIMDFINGSTRVGQTSLTRVSTVDTWTHIKITLTDGKITLYNLDNSNSYVIASNVEWTALRLLNFSDTTQIFRFRNVRVYPI